MVGEKKDTTFFKTAEKLFKNVEELNKSYITDKGANQQIHRKAIFRKKFKWFNTEYSFSELIDKEMSDGYPIKDFLNKEELNYFYSPENIRRDKKNGPDSLKFRAFEDTISKKTDIWTTRSLVSEWIAEFSKLTEGKAGIELTKVSLNI